MRPTLVFYEDKFITRFKVLVAVPGGSEGGTYLRQ